MKLIKLLTVAACAFALVAGSTMAQDKAEGKAKKSCCEKAKAKGEACSHPCCVEATKAGKTCEKCNPKKDEKKKEEAK